MTAERVLVPTFITDLGPTTENQLFNSAKENRGRIISHGQMIYLKTDSGAWFISQIKSLTWIGPSTLVVGGSIVRSRDDQVGFQVRMELDLRGNSGYSGEIAPDLDQIRLSPKTREYFAGFSRN